MEFSRYIPFLQILTIQWFLTSKGTNGCWNGTANRHRQDGECDIEGLNTNVSFIFDIGDKAALACNIFAISNDSSIYWLKDGAIIAKNLEAISSKYTVNLSVIRNNVSCFGDLYVLEFVVGADDLGQYDCGCQYENATSQHAFMLVVNIEPSDLILKLTGVAVAIVIVVIIVITITSLVYKKTRSNMQNRTVSDTSGVESQTQPLVVSLQAQRELPPHSQGEDPSLPPAPIFNNKRQPRSELYELEQLYNDFKNKITRDFY